jgi:hypothetical protein
VTNTDDRPGLPSEGAPDIDKTEINIRSWDPEGPRSQDLLSDWSSVVTWLLLENDASNNSSIVARVLVTAVNFLPSRCIQIYGAYTDRHTQTATWSHKPTLFLAYFPILKKSPYRCYATAR